MAYIIAHAVTDVWCMHLAPHNCEEPQPPKASTHFTECVLNLKSKRTTEINFCHGSTSNPQPLIDVRAFNHINRIASAALQFTKGHYSHISELNCSYQYNVSIQFFFNVVINIQLCRNVHLTITSVVNFLFHVMYLTIIFCIFLISHVVISVNFSRNHFS